MSDVSSVATSDSTTTVASAWSAIVGSSSDEEVGAVVSSGAGAGAGAGSDGGAGSGAGGGGGAGVAEDAGGSGAIGALAIGGGGSGVPSVAGAKLSGGPGIPIAIGSSGAGALGGASTDSAMIDCVQGSSPVMIGVTSTGDQPAARTKPTPSAIHRVVPVRRRVSDGNRSVLGGATG